MPSTSYPGLCGRQGGFHRRGHAKGKLACGSLTAWTDRGPSTERVSATTASRRSQLKLGSRVASIHQSRRLHHGPANHLPRSPQEGCARSECRAASRRSPPCERQPSPRTSPPWARRGNCRDSFPQSSPPRSTSARGPTARSVRADRRNTRTRPASRPVIAREPEERKSSRRWGQGNKDRPRGSCRRGAGLAPSIDPSFGARPRGHVPAGRGQASSNTGTQGGALDRLAARRGAKQAPPSTRAPRTASDDREKQVSLRMRQCERAATRSCRARKPHPSLPPTHHPRKKPQRGVQLPGDDHGGVTEGLPGKSRERSPTQEPSAHRGAPALSRTGGPAPSYKGGGNTRDPAADRSSPRSLPRRP